MRIMNCRNSVGDISFANLQSMGRSTMGGGVSLFVCFAVLATLINAATGTDDSNETERAYDHDIQGPDVTQKPLYEKDGFLAGEETPIWFANFNYDESHHAQYSYTRLRPKGIPMVKRAWNYWNRVKTESGFPARKIRLNHRSVPVAEPYRDEDLEEAQKNARINHYDSGDPFEKRSTYGNEVVYPTVLLVLDYGDVYPSDDEQKLWSVEQILMYALAFWGTVDSSLRHINNPRVSLRIAGIVITTSRPASPYLTVNEGKKTLINALTPMLDYWRAVGERKNSDFPIGSYDIVVHMTDIDPWYGKVHSNYDLVLLDHGDYGTASQGPPCTMKDQLGGIIIFDDFAFNGIARAVERMVKVLGGPTVNKDERIDWNNGLARSVATALKYTTCMSAPKEFHGPGTPVPAILAGELMPSVKQCELAGYAKDAWTCWDTEHSAGKSDCKSLQCSNQHVWGVTCSYVGPPLDGSFCNADNTKICLEGRCVDKTTRL